MSSTPTGIGDPEGQSTFCAACGELVIERDGYRIGRWNLDAGACKACKILLAGRFADRPGTWGARRLPVVVGSGWKQPQPR